MVHQAPCEDSAGVLSFDLHSVLLFVDREASSSEESTLQAHLVHGKAETKVICSRSPCSFSSKLQKESLTHRCQKQRGSCLGQPPHSGGAATSRRSLQRATIPPGAGGKYQELLGMCHAFLPIGDSHYVGSRTSKLSC